MVYLVSRMKARQLRWLWELAWTGSPLQVERHSGPFSPALAADPFSVMLPICVIEDAEESCPFPMEVLELEGSLVVMLALAMEVLVGALGLQKLCVLACGALGTIWQGCSNLRTSGRFSETPRQQ